MREMSGLVEFMRYISILTMDQLLNIPPKGWGVEVGSWGILWVCGFQPQCFDDALDQALLSHMN